ncbi:MAG: hypothetical protein JO273_05520 [Methylobacteriaceae bacterium]|nr:hypothetical protein [Methylobacteriaceae bacterium]
MPHMTSRLSERDRGDLDDLLNEGLEETFPASDPPALTQPRRGGDFGPQEREPLLWTPPQVFGRMEGSENGEMFEAPGRRLIFVACLAGCAILIIAIWMSLAA